MKPIRRCAKEEDLFFDEKPSNDTIWVLIDYLQNQYQTTKIIRSNCEDGLGSFWYNLDGILRSRRYGSMIILMKGNYLAGYCCYSKRDADYHVLPEITATNPFVEELSFMGLINPIHDPKVDKIVLEYMEILPYFRGQGLGTKLYEYFENKIVKQGYTSIHLESLDNSRTFWMEQGYKFGDNPCKDDYLHSCKQLK